jgi:hypothetical protein
VLTYVSPQAGDVSLLETMLQEFTAFERLSVAVTEADLSAIFRFTFL